VPSATADLNRSSRSARRQAVDARPERHIEGFASGYQGSDVHQKMHTATLQPLWRDWRFAPMLKVCEDVTLGGDEDGDTDSDGVLDAFEKHYYGSITNGANSDTDGDGADLQTEYRMAATPLVDTYRTRSPMVATSRRRIVCGRAQKMSVSDSANRSRTRSPQMAVL
jgi:hypothetical protein